MSAGLPRVHSRPRPHYGEPAWLDRLIGAIEGLTDAIRGDVPVAVALDSVGDGAPDTADLWEDEPRGHEWPISQAAAARVRAARVRERWTQEAFVRSHRGEGVTWSSSTQSAIERGTRLVSRAEADALGRVLGVHLSMVGGVWL